MSFPEGPFVRKVELAGGPGVEHVCPNCGVGITRPDFEAVRDELWLRLTAAYKERDSYHAKNDELRTRIAELELRCEVGERGGERQRARAYRAEARVKELEGALDRLCREVGNYTRATGTSAATEALSRAYMDGLDALHPQETE